MSMHIIGAELSVSDGTVVKHCLVLVVDFAAIVISDWNCELTCVVA